MAVSPARAAAFEILLRVEQDGSYASELLHADRLAPLDPRDHGLATELVMGVLRWQSLLDRRIAAASSHKQKLDSEVLLALRLGAYQLQFLSRVPARAAIFESVELVKAARKRSAAAFVNAVLRKLVKPDVRDAFAAIGSSSDIDALARNAAHPAWLTARWIERYGFGQACLICAYDQTIPQTAIHIYDDQYSNAGGGSELEAELAASGVQLTSGRLLTRAGRVVAGDVTKTSAYREGRFSIQDEASQLVATLAATAPGAVPANESSEAATDAQLTAELTVEHMKDRAILDCCAAPGGKASVLARFNPTATVFASDLHPHRARLLQNLSRWPNVHIVAADARSLPFSRTFECILADVPCSGTGTLARNPEIKWRLQAADLLDLQSRQLAILKSALAHLAIGGRLVYSTCSLEREENEAVIEGALEDTVYRAGEFELLDLRIELERLQRTGELSSPDIESLLDGPYLRTIPGVHPCDGFLAAMVERKIERNFERKIERKP